MNTFNDDPETEEAETDVEPETPSERAQRIEENKADDWYDERIDREMKEQKV